MRAIDVLPTLAAFTMIGLADAEEPYSPDPLQLGWPAETHSVAMPESGDWKVEYDNELDGVLQEKRVHVLALESANGQLTGRYKDERANGLESHSLFTGQVIPGSPAIVTLRQDDRPGYTAIYTGRIVSAGRIVGSYVDNRGFSGDWSLTLVTEPAIEPLASAPDALFLESVLGVYGKAIRGERYPFVNLRPPHRNLWTDEIQEVVAGTLSYGEVDYIGAARLIVPESGEYTVDLPGGGVQFSLNGQRLEAGNVELKKGLYEVEIYTNHWGQPYLTYAEVAVFKKGTVEKIPFVNSAADIEAFRSQRIAGRAVVEACEYLPKCIEFERN